MMNWKLAAVALALCLAVAEANILKAPFFGVKWSNGQTANINEYIDNTVQMLVPFIQEKGLDPMMLPDITEGFEVKPLWITYSASLRLHDGSMTGLVNLSRSGDQLVNYFAKMLRVKIQLRFEDLEFKYRYLVKVMNIGPTGGIVGSLNRLDVVADVLIDFNNDEIQLQQLSLTNIGRLRVKLTGNAVLDWLVNPIVTVFLRIFDTTIIKEVGIIIRSAVQGAIDEINANLKDTIARLESYN